MTKADELRELQQHISEVHGNKFWLTDMNSAWELVEEMRQDQRLVILKAWPPGHINRFNEKEYNWVADLVHETDKTRIYGYGDTAPEAICRVWWMWKQKK